jgi:hypothetical protein
MIIRIVKMTFRPEEVENFKKLFDSRKRLIRGFDGCHHLELWQDEHNKHVFFTYSHWESEDYLNGYRFSELFKDVWSKTKALLDAKPEAWSVVRNEVVAPD